MRDYLPLFTRLPADRQECWSRLETFAEYWHEVSCSPVDVTRQVLETETRLHLVLPDALVEWHRKFGRFLNRRHELSFTVPISTLLVEDDHLVIRTERVFNGMLEAKWGIPVSAMESEDPPVLSILGGRKYPCAERVSHFAIFSAMYDTVRSSSQDGSAVDNDAPFPPDGVRMEFPDSFGVIKTEIYEGKNWLALVSGTDWYVRQRDPLTGERSFIAHELRTGGLPP